MERKKRILLLILAAAGVILFLTGIRIALKRRKPPDSLLKSYFSCLEKGDYQGMYGFLSEISKEQITEEAYIKRNQNIYEGIDASDFQITTGKPEKRGKQTILPFTLTMHTIAGRMDVENEAVFSKKMGDSYKLEWSSHLIFPELGDRDQILVNRIPAERGCVYDREGRLLAGPQNALEIGLVPGQMDGKRELEIQAIGEVLGVEEETIEKALTASWVKEDSYVPIHTIPSFTKEDAAFYSQQDAIEKRHLLTRLSEFPGLVLKDITVRGYPLGEAAAHLMGYVQRVTAEDLKEHKGEGYGSSSVIGRTGVESLYEKELKGKDGCQIKIMNSQGVEKKVLAASYKEDGQDITLTIDSQLQEQLYQAFSEDKGTSAAINPKTGEVLALVSTPSYNNNLFVQGLTEGEWEALNEDEKKPMQNRFRAVFCPGSSLKPFIGAIALTEGVLTPEEDLGMEGDRWQKDESWGDYEITTLHTYERANLTNAMVYSDNIYFAKAALRIGEETLQKKFQELGFGERIPFPIWMTESQLCNEEGFGSEIQLADTGYGQGQVLVNPLHLAILYSAFVNGGNLIQPQLTMTEASAPVFWKEQVFDPETAEKMTEILRQVIENPEGTGSRARIEGLSLAGKTGTAEIKESQEDQKGTELGWFVVYTPDAETEDAVCIVSMVEDVKNRGGSGYLLEPLKNLLENRENSKNNS